MLNEENLNRALIKSQTDSLTKAGNTCTVTNRLVNSEISELFNKGFRLLNSKAIKSVDRDFLFLVEHTSNYQIVKDFSFEAQKWGDYLNVMDSFVRLLQIKPNHSLTLTMLGKCLANWSEEPVNPAKPFYPWVRQRKDDALIFLSKAVHSDSLNALALYFQAELLRRQDDSIIKAVDSVTRAIEIDEKFSQAYLIRGAAMESLGDNLGAIADFTKAIELDSTYAAAYYRRGLLRKKLNEFSEALDDLTKAMDIDPKYESRCSSERGQIKLHLGDSDGAKQDFERDSTRTKINYFKNKYRDSNS